MNTTVVDSELALLALAVAAEVVGLEAARARLRERVEERVAALRSSLEGVLEASAFCDSESASTGTESASTKKETHSGPKMVSERPQDVGVSEASEGPSDHNILRSEVRFRRQPFRARATRARPAAATSPDLEDPDQEVGERQLPRAREQLYLELPEPDDGHAEACRRVWRAFGRKRGLTPRERALVGEWLSSGIEPSFIVEEVESCREDKEGRPVGSLAYFRERIPQRWAAGGSGSDERHETRPPPPATPAAAVSLDISRAREIVVEIACESFGRELTAQERAELEHLGDEAAIEEFLERLGRE